jgi:hypothetical protein
MSSPELSQIPGLAKNIARVKRVEDRWREEALREPELQRINGWNVLPLTLWHIQELERVESPFLTAGMGTQPEDVGLFLWILSPHYNRNNRELRREFLRILFEEYATPQFRIFYRAIYRFLWVKSLMDIPPAPTSGIRVGTCTAASIINKVAGAYGWPKEQIIRERMAALYQYIKWIEINPDIPQFDPLQVRMIDYYGRKD